MIVFVGQAFLPDSSIILSGKKAWPTRATMLRLTGISKAFAGVQALRDVSFDLRAGEVHALVGENGAGKSTLIKAITGAHLPDEGTIEVHGQAVVDSTGSGEPLAHPAQRTFPVRLPSALASLDDSSRTCYFSRLRTGKTTLDPFTRSI
jgi:ABC-type Mn2+/Zn2+ transport system ATPase subunit